ncbi:hypothetical protein DPSP01_004717 [Paraphaeosphaeria sporulosa]
MSTAHTCFAGNFIIKSLTNVPLGLCNHAHRLRNKPPEQDTLHLALPPKHLLRPFSKLLFSTIGPIPPHTTPLLLQPAHAYRLRAGPRSDVLGDGEVVPEVRRNEVHAAEGIEFLVSGRRERDGVEEEDQA